jgi:hypothetical protein
MSAQDLHKAIGSARGNYKLKRWIIKGIPPIYEIEASLDISDKENAGEVVQALIGLQAAGRQVDVSVFPYGIPFPDGVLLNVGINIGPGPAEGGI